MVGVFGFAAFSATRFVTGLLDDPGLAEMAGHEMPSPKAARSSPSVGSWSSDSSTSFLNHRALALPVAG